MCNGDSSRTSLGGAIANLHPSSSRMLGCKHAVPFNCLLQFYNDLDPALPTQLTYTLDIPTPCEVRIHKSGDLTAGLESAGSILHSVKVHPGRNQLSLQLKARLDLGVGGDGIIGRSVSLVRGEEVLGEGIIGWN